MQLKTPKLKPLAAVVISHAMTVRSLIMSSALKGLNERYEIVYLYPNNLSVELPNSIKIAFTEKRSLLVKKVDYYLWYLTFFKYFRRTHSINEGYKSFKIVMLGRKTKVLLRAMSLPVVYEILIPILEKLIIRYDNEIYRCMEELSPAVILLPGAAFDSFGLETVKCARKLSIRSIMLAAHWDLLSAKGLLRGEPDIICVWGQQMYDMAVNTHGIAAEKVRIIGVPQFEIYKNEIGKDDARKHLGLPLGKKIFLFAGIGAPFDEMSILAHMDGLIGTGLPSDVLVLYRPHPKKHQRKNEKDFGQYRFKNIVLDPQNACPDTAIFKDTFNYYSNLLYSIDGLVSPFSTMTVEAAVCGKPCLAIAFSDDVHEWKFEHALSNEHIQPLLNYKWVALCTKKEDLHASLISLLETAAKPNIAKEIRQDISSIVHSGEDSYSKRLVELVSKVRR